jgi:hypothetical protein
VRSSVICKGACLGADDDAHPLDQGVIESGRSGDGLRELGCCAKLSAPGNPTVVGDSMESLVPPLVGTQAESRDAGRVAAGSVSSRRLIWQGRPQT